MTIINEKELIHKAVRRNYMVTENSMSEVIKQMKGKKVYAVGFNGNRFFGIQLTSNKQTDKMGGLKEWSAVLDSKTCESCQKMNGQVVPITEPFIFDSGDKIYKIDEPPLHGFNSYGNKKTPAAIPGTENDFISRFEEPTCRCVAVHIEHPTQEELHFDTGVTFEIEEFEEEVDRFLLDVVEPLQQLWERSPNKIPDEVYREVVEHFESNTRFYDGLIKEMKRKGIIETLKNNNYI